jgi:hypothetical protein
MNDEQSITSDGLEMTRTDNSSIPLSTGDSVVIHQHIHAHHSTLNMVQGHQFNSPPNHGKHIMLDISTGSAVLKNPMASDEHRKKKIHGWLSAPDPSSNHDAACEKRQPNTGSWFIDGEAFAEWKSKPSSFLWLHGIRELFLFKSIMANTDRAIACDSGMRQNCAQASSGFELREYS